MAKHKNLEFDFSGSPKELEEVNYIVIHHTGVDADQTVETIHDYHKNHRGWAGIGYHYLIRQDGSIYKGRPDDWQGVHDSDRNSDSIGIALTGDLQKSEPSDAQYKTLGRKLAKLTGKYKKAEIVPHAGTRENPGYCPGSKFDFERVKNIEMKQGIPLTVPGESAEIAGYGVAVLAGAILLAMLHEE